MESDVLEAGLFDIGLCEDAAVLHAGKVVGLHRFCFFFGSDEALLLAPAAFDTLLAPFHAAAAGTDGLSGDGDKEWIGVATGQDAQGDP